MSEDSTTPSPKERRRFFRVDDKIVLFYREVSPEEVRPAAELSDNLFSIASNFTQLSHDTRQRLKKLKRDQPEVADYLNLLERKIDLIAQILMRTEASRCDQPTRAVNLSAAGIAFAAEKILAPGCLLEIKMILPHSLIAIHALGKVVYCDENLQLSNKFPYHVGLDFLDLPEEEKEYLIRYVVKKQMQQIRGKKRG